MPGGRNTVLEPIVTYFVKRPGLEINVYEIAEALDFTVTQVKSSIYNASRRDSWGSYNIQEVKSKLSYRYVPQSIETNPSCGSQTTSLKVRPQTSHRVFEELGQAKDGSVILECEDGKLYRAQEL